MSNTVALFLALCLVPDAKAMQCAFGAGSFAGGCFCVLSNGTTACISAYGTRQSLLANGYMSLGWLLNYDAVGCEATATSYEPVDESNSFGFKSFCTQVVRACCWNATTKWLDAQITSFEAWVLRRRNKRVLPSKYLRVGNVTLSSVHAFTTNAAADSIADTGATDTSTDVATNTGTSDSGDDDLVSTDTWTDVAANTPNNNCANYTSAYERTHAGRNPIWLRNSIADSWTVTNIPHRFTPTDAAIFVVGATAGTCCDVDGVVCYKCVVARQPIVVGVESFCCGSASRHG
jgi:hypothetical protein